MIQQFHFWEYRPPKMKTLTQKDTYTTTFIAELFIIANTKKQPKCSLIDEWMKMWYTHLHTHTHNKILLTH